MEKVAGEMQRGLRFVTDLKQTDIFLTTRSYYRSKPQKIRDAEALGIPIYVLRSNDIVQMRRCLDAICAGGSEHPPAYHLQHLLAEYQGLNSYGMGMELNKKVKPSRKK